MFYSRIEVGVGAGAGQQIFAQLQLLYLKKKYSSGSIQKPSHQSCRTGGVVL